jgi:hypothetical protein
VQILGILEGFVDDRGGVGVIEEIVAEEGIAMPALTVENDCHRGP